MNLCVKSFECVYLYNFATTKIGAVIYMCAKDIQRVYLYDFTSTKQ